jgi:hypothetical protein
MPTPDKIQKLIGLAQIGHVRGIETSLDEIERDTPNCREFVARMRSYIQRVELERCADELTAVRSRHE